MQVIEVPDDADGYAVVRDALLALGAVQAERSELMQAQLASRRAESDSALLKRQLLELQLCRAQLSELHGELEQASKKRPLEETAPPNDAAPISSQVECY